MKSIVSSWGNIYSKNITYLDSMEDLKIGKSFLPIGNTNSYGDSVIPNDDFLIKMNNKSLYDDYIDSSMTIYEYLVHTKSLLYGIPGKSNVTIAGAIASDVHGKDGYWGGSFIKNIDSLLISLPSGEIIECSRYKNPDIFFTSIGGYGLTGYILGVRFKKNSIKFSSIFKGTVKKGEGILNLFQSFNTDDNTYSVAWVDLLNKNYRWVLSKHSPIEDNSPEIDIENNNDGELPFSFSFVGSNFMNSMKLINSVFYHLKKEKNKHEDLSKVLFPLGTITNTKNLASKRKIIQIQFSVPLKYSKKIPFLMDCLILSQKPILCSIKKLSANETNLNLSFVQDGWTVAVDFCEENFDHKGIRKFYKELISVEGRIYLAKDSTLNKDEFFEMYDNLFEWKKIVKEIDPKNKFQSLMSNRLELKNW